MNCESSVVNTISNGSCAQAARTIELLNNTSYYILHYLKPTRKWNKMISAKQRIDLVRYADVNWTQISDHIRGMDYRDFLCTPYWKAIAAHTRFRAGYRCQLCNHTNHLVTHHRDYAIHGREHAHMHELIVLCKNCHDRFHGQVAFPQSVPRNGCVNFFVICGFIIFILLFVWFCMQRQ